MAHGDHLKYSGKPKAGKKTFLRLVSYVACDGTVADRNRCTDRCEHRSQSHRIVHAPTDYQ